jgi:hypothetical protein
MKKFQDALKTCDGSSSGPDDIHYEMIKQLDEKEKEMLLGICNNIWKQGSYPEELRKAFTIPILNMSVPIESVIKGQAQDFQCHNFFYLLSL